MITNTMIKELQLGALRLRNNLLFAPLCGCSNLPTRLLSKKNGAGITFVEMTKGDAVVRHNKKTMRLLYFEESERPIGMQICGGEPDIMAETARIITDLGPDLIDINMGCPVKKIVNTEAGCALLKDPPKAARVISAVVGATHLPVTVKMRAGWDHDSLKHRELARAVEDSGAVAVTLHPRTRSQFFEGRADWNLIGEIKKEVGIPVIGNGDVKNPEDAKRMFEQTGCDGIMIGRAALGNPWLFNEIEAYLTTGEKPAGPDIREVLAALREHFDQMMRVEGERNGIQLMRRHASWYIKGKPGAARLRARLNTMQTADDFLAIYDEFKRKGSEPANAAAGHER